MRGTPLGESRSGDNRRSGRFTARRDAARREWADRVADLFAAGLLEEDVVLVVHAGRAYYARSLPLVAPAVCAVRIPTEGLAIGEPLA